MRPVCRRLFLLWLVAEGVALLLAWPTVWREANTYIGHLLPSPTPIVDPQPLPVYPEYHFNETPLPCYMYVHPQDGIDYHCRKIPNVR